MGSLVWRRFCNCLIAALGGAAIHDWISEDPLQLFYALSLVLAGIGMIDLAAAGGLCWKTGNWGPFWDQSFLGLFVLQFGDKGQFILAATSRPDGCLGLFAASRWLAGRHAGLRPGA